MAKNTFKDLLDHVAKFSAEEAYAEIERLIQFDPQLLVVKPWYMINVMNSTTISNKHLNYIIKVYMSQNIEREYAYHACNTAINKQDTDLETLMLVEEWYESGKVDFVGNLKVKMLQHPVRINNENVSEVETLCRQFAKEISEAYKNRTTYSSSENCITKQWLENKVKESSNNAEFVAALKLREYFDIVYEIIKNKHMNVETFEYMCSVKGVSKIAGDYIGEIANSDVIDHIVNKYRKASYLERVIRNQNTKQETFDKACLKLAATKGYDVKWLANHKRCNEVLKHQLLVSLVIEV